MALTIKHKRWPKWLVCLDATAWDTTNDYIGPKPEIYENGAALVLDHTAITVQDTVSVGPVSSGTAFSNYAGSDLGIWRSENGMEWRIRMYAIGASWLYGEYFSTVGLFYGTGFNRYAYWNGSAQCPSTVTIINHNTSLLHKNQAGILADCELTTFAAFNANNFSMFASSPSNGPSDVIAAAEPIIDSANFFYIDGDNQTSTTSCLNGIGDYTDVTMTTAAEGYTPSSRTITFTCNMDDTSFQGGTAPSGFSHKEFIIRGENPSAFVFGNKPVAGDDLDLDTFTVTPVSGLKAGTYSVDIVVIGNVPQNAATDIEAGGISSGENTVRIRVTFVVT